MTSNKKIDTSIAVIALGGSENSLSVARNLSSYGITVYVSGKKSMCWALHSKYPKQKFTVNDDNDSKSYWKQLLLEKPRPELLGSVIYPCNDEAIEFIAENFEAIHENYKMPPFDAHLQTKFLDKKETLRLAKSIGVPIPQYWNIQHIEQLDDIKKEIKFPVMIKPIHSHVFVKQMGRKLIIIEDDIDELYDQTKQVLDKKLDIMIVEMVPGDDSLASSYNAFIDEDGELLYEFTKSVIRRYPPNAGGGTYHQMERLADTAELGRKFFQGLGFKGVANIEFKRDLRDNQLKVIEVNARLTAAQPLIVGSGLPIDYMIYLRSTGQDIELTTQPAYTGRLWYPLQDFLSFRRLNREGKLSFLEWIISIKLPGTTLPLFSLQDPMPMLVSMKTIIKKINSRTFK